ncbi:hypothetical protein NHQ30_007611 [Ciborinia camelliae]|nr:hypothetical protein NHQ30_007611 [Ciborinia camelliae]
MSNSVEPTQFTNTTNNKVVSFTRRFPKDIETIIFEISCYHERIVPIHMSEARVDIEGDANEPPHPWPFLCFRSSNPIPAIMHVDSNAREIALRHYKLGFGIEDVVSEKVRKADKSGLAQGRIYVNPISDIICAQPGPRWMLFMRKMKDLKAEQLALNNSSWFAPFESHFTLALCPVDGSHNSGWIDERSEVTATWIHNQPTELYSEVSYTRANFTTAWNRWIKPLETFYCCTAMEVASEVTKNLAVVQLLQKEQNNIADKEGYDRQRLEECPEWLYNKLDTWEKPRHKFLLHWQ